MDNSKRIRVVFQDDDILSETQKLDGLNRSWVLLKPNHQNATVSGVASHLLHAFQLHRSCPYGLLLSISGFVLPPFESTCILKDDEIIRVSKRRDTLSLEGNDGANEVRKLKAVEKRPVNNGLLLLANEEFEKEKGGYESDEPEEEFEEEDEEDLLEDMENPSGENMDPKNRKRKAREKLLQVSKKKKQRTEAPGNFASDAHTGKPENACQDGDTTKKTSLSSKEKNTDPNADDTVENNEGNSKLSGMIDESTPGKRNDDMQENNKETEEAKTAPKETKKLPSRSARRKYAKRRWLREMAKIQRTNAVCESEGLRNWKEDHAKAEWNKVDVQSKGLRNWKEDHAKAEWNKVDVQSKGLQKWKKHRSDAERTELDGQPKGLLHWKQSFQKNQPFKGKKRQQRNQNDYFNKHLDQNGDVHEQQSKPIGEHGQSTQTNHESDQPNQQVDEQPSQENGGLQHQSMQKDDALVQSAQESDEENEVVPIVIRPGHIRFEPLDKGLKDKEETVQKNHLPAETFQWNGITSKKKGQKWGTESRAFTPKNDYNNSNKHNSEVLSTEKEKQPEREVDFDRLPPFAGTPKVGDLVAYRVLELSSSWTPELSPFRVGKVSWYDAQSSQTMLVPVSEYPIVPKVGDGNDDVHLDSSLYKEDGALEVDFWSLIDVRMFKNGSSGPGSGENAPETMLPGRNENETLVTSSENGEVIQVKETEPSTAAGNDGVNLWDQVSEALSSKKEQLSKESSWGKPPKKAQPSPGSSWGKNAQKVPSPQQENSWGRGSKQSGSGGKSSWSYRALRGSALGPTMAMLRSKKDM